MPPGAVTLSPNESDGVTRLATFLDRTTFDSSMPNATPCRRFVLKFIVTPVGASAASIAVPLLHTLSPLEHVTVFVPTPVKPASHALPSGAI
jgi:hypothetical protein